MMTRRDRKTETAVDRAHILVVDDEPNVRKVLGALLEQAGYVTTRAANAEEALALVRAQDPDVVISDLKMPGMDGLGLLRKLKEVFPEIPVILLTAHGTIEAAVEAMKHGALDFLTKPFEKDRVLEVVAKGLGQSGCSRLEFQGPFSPDALCGMIGRSAAMADLRRLVERLAPSPSTVLIAGETGTGKELVAEALHRLSPRAGRPFIKINCGALPDTLVEAELFGYESGAFTGALRAKPGRFELAHGGTLFLDEIGELPTAAQVKLLRVLQDGVVDRIGATQPHRIDVRLIAATNRDLEQDARDGAFRQDLLFRIRVVEIRVPPLRDRLDDIPLLVDFFLAKHSKRLHHPRPEVTPDTIASLAARSWTGNVRELENAVERAMLLAEGPSLSPADLGILDAASAAAAGSPSPTDSSPSTGIKGAARAAAAAAERRMIRAAMESTGGNVTQAAERLGLSRRGLQLKLKELGLRPGS
jgi:DNA-binding NtrC family response regulator